MVTLMQRRREMMRLASIGPSINDYVHDGVSFWIDGIENTRSGHNANATAWEDLSPNEIDFTYHSTSVIGADYCIPNDKMTGTKYLGTTVGYTVEVVMDFIATDNNQMLMPWAGNGYGTVWIGTISGEQILYFSSGSTDGSKGVPIRSGITTYTARGTDHMFINGVEQAIVASGATWSKKYAVFGYYNASYPRTVKSKIYAVRIHNRNLTDAEILRNATIDAARFK